MSDYCDGTSYKESDFFQKYPTALQIILYYDDVEICNPLGSKSKIHKLGKFLPHIHFTYIAVVSHRTVLLHIGQY